jgi:hypothetical protein
MAEDKKFIQKAIKRPGDLTRKAKAAGMTIAQYCAQSNLSPLSQDQCNFWKKVLKPAAKKRKKD